jgi:uncharacterized protein (TIGR03435 family)
MQFRAAAALIAAFCAVRTSRPQSQEPPPFEVASVKPTAGGPLKVQSDPGRLTITDESLDVLIKLAYGLRDYQYEGPSWLRTTRYDIAATTSAPQPRSTQMKMLRALLEDRFQLKTHVEARTMPVYWLVVGKNGPKLKPMDTSLPVPFDLYYNIRLVPAANGSTQFEAVGTLGLLCDFLTRLAERPVLDHTGIDGVFELKLLCGIDGFPGYESSPSVFDAVQAQMGLKLEPHPDSVKVTVVDRVEKPTGN